MFDQIIGNEKAKTILKRLLKRDRTPHSLLFTGPVGIGKKQFAIEISKALLCKNSEDSFACGNCKSCLRGGNFELPKPDKKEDHAKVIFSKHPDLGTVIPYRKKNILVDAIRNLEKEANFRPYEGKARIFIIDDAEKMNDSATNALLKTLEEPSETTYLFLVTSRPAELRPTIHSRCQKIAFAPIEVSEIEEYLVKTKKMPTEDAKLVAKLSNGSFTKANEFDLEYFFQQRTKMLDLIRSLNSGRNLSILLKISEEIGDPKNKELYEENLKNLQSLIHDIWTLKNEPASELKNFDISDDLKHVAENSNTQNLLNWQMEIDRLLVDLKSNLNKKIATDALFMRMAS